MPWKSRLGKLDTPERAGVLCSLGTLKGMKLVNQGSPLRNNNGIQHNASMCGYTAKQCCKARATTSGKRSDDAIALKRVLII